MRLKRLDQAVKTRRTGSPLLGAAPFGGASGDPLRGLAQKYYGDPTLWETIFKANRDKVERGLPVEGTALLVPEPKRR